MAASYVLVCGSVHCFLPILHRCNAHIIFKNSQKIIITLKS
ncbi:hypothetical protein CLOSTHATH_04104 [Hungatella hathewayi DSM 13479]|uniref:Uncharacterized protein n=1 Tax=Hungatella hathewayi DSM 13479 TaxID=566550 RepID=D3AKG1_9FIRM|nr:hypothetical protein CLOSTHATH_04104 [Hungatella hathewayi DSM 13479]